MRIEEQIESCENLIEYYRDMQQYHYMHKFMQIKQNLLEVLEIKNTRLKTEEIIKWKRFTSVINAVTL